MKKQTILFAALLAGALSFIFVSCSKNSNGDQTVPDGKQNLSVFLTDGPGYFDNVYVDIKSVKVLVDTCNNTSLWQGIAQGCQTWQDLNIKPGVYDLLSLRNGTDTLLAQGNVVTGKVVLIKIELGSNNSLVKDSVKYPLNLTKITEPYIYLTLTGKEWEKYEKNKSRLWLDFDVARSIIAMGNQFYLKPVIHLFTKSTTGAIGGIVTPRAAYPVISVYNSTDTAYALPDAYGRFLVRGLQAGTYNMLINASNGYVDSTITNIKVNVGELDLERIELRKQ